MANFIKLTIVLVWLGALGWLAATTDWRAPAESPGAEGLLALEMEPLDPLAPDYEESWFGVYLRDIKVGYTRSALERKETAILFEDEMRWDLQMMGARRQIRMNQRGELSPDFSLSALHFRLDSQGATLEAVARHRGKLLDAVISSGSGNEQTMQLAVPEQLTVPVAATFHFRKNGLKTGERLELEVFDPFAQQTSTMTFDVEAREEMEAGGKTRALYRVRQELLGNVSTAWMDETARVWRERTAEGLELRRESPEEATRNIKGGEFDLGEFFAVQVSGTLENIPSLREAKYFLEGVGEGFDDIAGFRQRAERTSAGVHITLTREDVPGEGGYTLPYRGEEFASLLAAEPFVPVGHPRLAEVAREIAGDESDPVAAARKLNEWVFENLRKQNVVGVPNALEALETRSGDCNEHATLLVGLARTLGIPARIAVGLVHLGGSFYYHAWTELFVGQWVSADATVNQMPADVTRIRLAQGNMGEQARLTSLLGKLKITIEESK